MGVRTVLGPLTTRCIGRQKDERQRELLERDISKDNFVNAVDDLIEEFEDLDEHEACQVLDELGRSLPEIPESVYSDENLVPGCQSRVWMVCGLSEEEPKRLTIQADSDAIIVKGLVSVLLEIYVGQTPAEAIEIDYATIFEKLGLGRLITPQRKNGLFSMVKTVRQFAADQLGQTSIPTLAPSVAVKAEAPVPTRSIESIAKEFPILQRPLPGGKRPVFLDSGASSQKPHCVIEKERECEEEYYANAFRGRYYFGQRVDDEIESSRQKVASLIGAAGSDEVAFTAGTTLSLNMIAFGWGRKRLSPGDEIVITEMEHHANYVPWQQLAKETGATLRILSINDRYELSMDEVADTLNASTKIVAITSMSNVLGTINPIAEITRAAHDVGAVVVVDAAQSVPHEVTDVATSGADFLVFSGHKVYGPSGVGVLYGKRERLAQMDPIAFGGHMIREVGRTESTWADPPARFEAGTMPIVQIIGLGAAVDFVRSVGFDAIGKLERELTLAAHQQLSEIEGLKIHGPEVSKKGAIVSFSIDGIATEDLAIRLDQHGVFTRHGHHCAMVLHEKLGVAATTRASFGLYNTLEDVNALTTAVREGVADIRR